MSARQWHWSYNGQFCFHYSAAWKTGDASQMSSKFTTQVSALWTRTSRDVGTLCHMNISVAQGALQPLHIVKRHSYHHTYHRCLIHYSHYPGTILHRVSLCCKSCLFWQCVKGSVKKQKVVCQGPFMAHYSVKCSCRSYQKNPPSPYTRTNSGTGWQLMTGSPTYQ